MHRRLQRPHVIGQFLALVAQRLKLGPGRQISSQLRLRLKPSSKTRRTALSFSPGEYRIEVDRREPPRGGSFPFTSSLLSM
jgi:hypothetical protein